ncbi:MAG: hypothetical protein ACPHO4_15780 [Longimicrobiales bacterium]
MTEKPIPQIRTPPSGPGKDASVPPEQQVFFCDLCGNQMLNLHCKLICERCGYKRDCSDP